MVTKGYQKGVYDRVTPGTSLAIALPSPDLCVGAHRYILASGFCSSGLRENARSHHVRIQRQAALNQAAALDLRK